MTLEMLMAFTVNPILSGRNRSGRIQHSYNRQPWHIPPALTETIPASDKRAQFVGVEAYQAAGGEILRDLFGPMTVAGFRMPALLDRLVSTS